MFFRQYLTQFDVMPGLAGRLICVCVAEEAGNRRRAVRSLMRHCVKQSQFAENREQAEDIGAIAGCLCGTKPILAAGFALL
jgi:hypothetical protein